MGLVLLTVVLAGCTEPAVPPGPGPGPGQPAAVKKTCGAGTNMSAPSTHVSDDVAQPPAPALAAALDGGAQQQQQQQQQQGNESLTIGTLMPLTGALSAFGPDGRNATILAVEEINAAGGINGAPVRLTHQDDKSTDTAAAPQAFQALRAAGADAIIGGYASSITQAILDGAIGAEVMVVTPASTSPALTAEPRNNQGFFLRVPPSDALQGKVLARVVYNDGCRTATVLQLDNAYGQGLGRVFAETFRSLGGTVQPSNIISFGENAATFTSEVQRAASANTDAVVLVAYPGQGAPIMKDAFQRGLMQRSVFFFSEGVNDPKFVADSGRDANNNVILAGLRGTAPGDVRTEAFASFNSSFAQRFGGKAPALFAKEAYDAAWMIALAAECGNANTGRAIKDNIRRVANNDGPTDVPVSGGNITLSAIAQVPGCNINYQGAAHDFDFDTRGDPSDGRYTVWQVQADGSIATVEEGLEP